MTDHIERVHGVHVTPVDEQVLLSVGPPCGGNIVLVYTRAEWAEFLRDAKAGAFDLDPAPVTPSPDHDMITGAPIGPVRQ